MNDHDLRIVNKQLPTGDHVGMPAELQLFRPASADRVLQAIDRMSRRIDDLARELNCLGHFDEDPDRPRAA